MGGGGGWGDVELGFRVGNYVFVYGTLSHF